MGSKLLVIIASGDRETVLAGLMYSRNAITQGWMDDVKVVFFGPSEQLITEDDLVADEVRNIALVGETFACETISDGGGFSGELEKMGVKVVGVGTTISNFINEGYIPMVW